MSLKVKVLFFGATADVIGQRFMDVEVPDESVARTAFEQIVNNFPKLKQHKLLFSINQNYAAGDERLKGGDELAVFTAVSGG